MCQHTGNWPKWDGLLKTMILKIQYRASLVGIRQPCQLPYLQLALFIDTALEHTDLEASQRLSSNALKEFPTNILAWAELNEVQNNCL